MSSTVGLKITTAESFAKIVSIIRKYDALPISEIKHRIDKKTYLLLYDYTDESGVASIIKCYNELSNIGIDVELYEHDRPCKVQFLKNLSNMYQEISDEVDAEIDAESDE